MNEKSELKTLAKELHAPARKRFQTRQTVTLGINDLWQTDLVEMGTLPKYGNQNYRYILMVIDTFSKKGYARKLKSKTGPEVAGAMRSIIKEAGAAPRNIQSDEGKEYYNKHFKQLMKEHDINHYHTFSDKKAAIVERWNRTIKTRMWKKFTERNSTKWIDILDDIIADYNNAKHSTIKMAPNAVGKDDEDNIKMLLGVSKTSIAKAKFQVGDVVRINRYKNIFVKGYKPNWTEELFKVKKVKNTVPVTYLLEDLLGEEIEGSFYEQEMKRTKLPDFARIEKILARKKDRAGKVTKIKVRWLNYPSKFDSWEDPDIVEEFE